MALYLYDYVLVKKEGRDAVDVRKWEAPITQSIKSIVPKASNIVVVKDGYSFAPAGQPVHESPTNISSAFSLLYPFEK